MARKLTVLGIAALLLAVPLSSAADTKPTDFSQCDPRWKDQYMAQKTNWPTICDAGGQLTVLSMITDGCGLKVPDTKDDINPGTLN